MTAIIGAGPVGNYAAYQLASKGHKVTVYESKSKIGEPVQCTGILTGQAEKLVYIDDDVIRNRISTARLHAPNGEVIDIKMKNPNIVVDRAKFDQMLADMAIGEGVKILKGHKFHSYSKGKAKINDSTIEPEWLIGADGPNSRVARSANMLTNRKLLVGSQVRAECFTEDESIMNIYLGIGCFAWSVPESKCVSRIGVVSHDHRHNLLPWLVKKNKAKVIGHQGGLIPLYNPRQKLMKGNVLLIGDAATQVKPTTFGGIVPGLLAARELGKGIEDYEKRCRKKLHRDLWLGLKIRKVMDKFSYKDYNELVRMFSSGKAKDIISRHDRDFPSQFMLKLLLARPKLLKFGLKGLFA